MSKDILGDRIKVGTNPQLGNPDDPLDLLTVAGANGTIAWFADYDNSGSAPNGFNLRLAQARGTAAVPLSLANGDPIFEIESFAYNGTGWSETAEIKGFVDGAVSNGQTPPSRIEIWTNLLNAVPTKKFTVDALGKTTVFTATTATAGLNVPHGVAPTSPVNGDIWTTSAGGLFAQINAVTQNYAPVASPTFTGTVTAAAVTMTGQLTVNNANAAIMNSGTANNTVISSAGTLGSGNGAYIRMYGQTAGGTPGNLDIVSGSSGTVTVFSSGSASLTIPNTGIITTNNTTDSTSISTGGLILLGGLGVAKRLTLDGATGKTLRITNATANAAVAVTLGLGPTGSTAGTPQGWMRIDIAGTDRYIPFW